jgi:hypothetical protein
MKAEKIDLSSLDPAGDREHWEGLIASVASRAWAARRRRHGVVDQLFVWARPALALAATVALGIWVGALLSAHRPGATAASVQDPAFTLARWATADENPPTASILEVLGEGHDDR